MKNLLLIIILSCVIQLKGQIKVTGFIEIGHLSEQFELTKIVKYKSGENVMDAYHIIHLANNALYTDVNIKFSYKNIYVEQQIFNIMNYPDDGYTFDPIDILYKTRVYYKLKGFNIGYEHMCSHPVISDIYDLKPIARRASHDKIFIRYTFNAN